MAKSDPRTTRTDPRVKKEKSRKIAIRRARRTIQVRTLVCLLLFGVLCFGLLFVRLYDLTIRQHDELLDRASRQQTMSMTLSASRGSIYSSDGKTLATSATADTVFLDPKAIQDRAADLDKKREEILKNGLKAGEKLPCTGEEYKELIASTLAEILEIDKEKITGAMEKTWSQYEILKKRVERTTGDKIREFIKNSDNISGGRIQGIHLESDAKRYYPHTSLAAHVLGFLGPENQGAYGLEAMYNSQLDGTTGLVVTARDGLQKELMFQYEQYYDAENGNDLYLTLDSSIQYYVERGLEDMVERYGAKNGAAGVVLDVNTGAILAIASSPTYDLMAPREIYDPILQQELAAADEAAPPSDSAEGEDGSNAAEDRAHSDEYWQKKAELQHRQWRSKAVNDTYEPGSTYKILTLTMALEEGTVTKNSTFNCNGSIKVADRTIKCSKRAGHGTQTLAEATANSCNPAFINIGLSVGPERYRQYMDDFGLTSPTGVDLQGEAQGVAAKKLTTLDLACYAFGQNFTVTPIQLIAAQAACVNGGYLYTPYVVDRIEDGDGNVVFQHDATPVRQVVSEETSAIVREILEGVVDGGTGRNGQVAGYRIGGKTGTADKRGTKDVVVSFLAFAPADDPQIMMLLTMDTPARDTGTYVSGGNMVAPTASAVMGDILPYLGIMPQYSEDELAFADATVPYVVGLTGEAAAAKLKEYGFESCRTIGSGETVTDQTPAGGAIVPGSAEILLYMDAEKPTDPRPMPNLVGLTAAEANRKLTDSGFIMRAAGASLENTNVRVIGQSHAEGVLTDPGTVVTVQMGQRANHSD